jgi:hypothetical protein
MAAGPVRIRGRARAPAVWSRVDRARRCACNYPAAPSPVQEATLELMALIVRARPEDAPAAGAVLQHCTWLLAAACDGLLPPECSGPRLRGALASAARAALPPLADAGVAGCACEAALPVLCRAVVLAAGDAAAEAEWLAVVCDALDAAPGLAARLAPALPLLPSGPEAAAPLAACWRAAVASLCCPEGAGERRTSGGLPRPSVRAAVSRNAPALACVAPRGASACLPACLPGRSALLAPERRENADPL